MRWVAVVLAAVALVAAGCSNGATGPTGTVTGFYIREGGPAGIQKAGARPAGVGVPLSGTITFQGANGPAIALNSDSTGKFSGQLPTGTYRVTAESSSIGGGPCSRPLTARVKSGKTVTLDVICDIR